MRIYFEKASSFTPPKKTAYNRQVPGRTKSGESLRCTINERSERIVAHVKMQDGCGGDLFCQVKDLAFSKQIVSKR